MDGYKLGVVDSAAPGSGFLAQQLDALLGPLGYHCLHRVAGLGEEKVAADHLVIGPGGAFGVWEVQLAAEVRAGVDGRVWSGGQPMDGRIDQALAQGELLGALIGIHVTAIVAIHGAEVKSSPVTRSVHLTRAAEVPALIERRAAHRSRSAVEASATRARQVLSVASWAPPQRQNFQGSLGGSPAQPQRKRSGTLARLLRRR